MGFLLGSWFQLQCLASRSVELGASFILVRERAKTR
jgi:hypothetical protein